MTDKVMIDGVDVSKCYDYNKETGICRTGFTGFRVDEIPYCNGFNCNYKRWQQTLQESTRYKQALEKIEEAITEINSIIIDKQVNIESDVIEWKNLYMKKIKQILIIINEVKDV